MLPDTGSGDGFSVRFHTDVPYCHSPQVCLVDINLPICGISLIMTILFVKLPTPPGTMREKFGRIDWMCVSFIDPCRCISDLSYIHSGNLLVIGSTASFVIALTWGGITHPWSSAQVLVPLTLGIFGFVLFITYEVTLAKNPIVRVLSTARRLIAD